MFWVFKLSFVVDIWDFFDLATIWANLWKIWQFFSNHLVTLIDTKNQLWPYFWNCVLLLTKTTKTYKAKWNFWSKSHKQTSLFQLQFGSNNTIVINNSCSSSNNNNNGSSSGNNNNSFMPTLVEITFTMMDWGDKLTSALFFCALADCLFAVCDEMAAASFHPFVVSLTLREMVNFYKVDVPLSQLGKNINLFGHFMFWVDFLKLTFWYVYSLGSWHF